MYINLTLNCRVCVRVVFLGLLCMFLPSLTTVEWMDQQHFAKTKMGYISLPSNLNAIIGITSYCCVILKMVILHDAIKTIHNGVLCLFFKKKEQKPVSLKKNKKIIRIEKTGGLFFEKNRFFSTLIIFEPFCDFPLIARSGTSHVTISLFGCVPHT